MFSNDFTAFTHELIPDIEIAGTYCIYGLGQVIYSSKIVVEFNAAC